MQIRIIELKRDDIYPTVFTLLPLTSLKPHRRRSLTATGCHGYFPLGPRHVSAHPETPREWLAERNTNPISLREVRLAASPTTTRARVPPPAALGMAGPKAAEDGSAAPLLPAQAGERSSGGVGGGATSAQTLGNVVVSIVGTGVLGLPYAFRAAGWVAGSIGVAAAGSATLYCMLLLVSTLACPPIPPY